MQCGSPPTLGTSTAPNEPGSPRRGSTGPGQRSPTTSSRRPSRSTLCRSLRTGCADLSLNGRGRWFPSGPFSVTPQGAVTTWDLKAPRGWQQPEVRGRLKEVAKHSLVLGVVLLRQQALVVASASARTNTAPARSSSPCWASACTSQKVQTRNVPSAPSRPSLDIPSVPYLRTRPFSVNVSVMASTVATTRWSSAGRKPTREMTYF
jgi:hypothetical protein